MDSAIAKGLTRGHFFIRVLLNDEITVSRALSVTESRIWSR